jgi:hypothetical protein
MATIWITYAWDDNVNQDVDYVAQELEATGLTIKLDRWNLRAGRRLWAQLETFIQDPSQSDAWLLFATTASLGSEACKEEYAYALDRALNTRGENFPVIALFPATVDDTLIPAGIRTRLYVSITDPEWKEHIKAAAEGRAPTVGRPTVSPYHLQIHRLQSGNRFTVEVRPRAGTWAPFVAGVPLSEKEAVNPGMLRGARGHPPNMGSLSGYCEKSSADGVWWLISAQDEATPTQSYFISCTRLPSRMIFGPLNGPHYSCSLVDGQ